MKLDSFYSLRKDFIILGLTGRAGAGCSNVAAKLSQDDFIIQSKYEKPDELLKPEQIKFDICYNYLKANDNCSKFEIINYKNVLLLNLLFEASKEREPISYILKVLTQYGDGYDVYSNRFGLKSDKVCIDNMETFLKEQIHCHLQKIPENKSANLYEWLKEVQGDSFINYFFEEYKNFAEDFYDILNKHDLTKRTRFVHDIAINLRQTGKCYQVPISKDKNDLTFIYTVAESINRLIKLWRQKHKKARIVIDALKNSLELLYFKEKYSGFYMLAINKDEDERKYYIKNIITKKYEGKSDIHIDEIIALDDYEYKGDNEAV